MVSKSLRLVLVVLTGLLPERYFKTTVFGLTGHSADYVILVIGSNAGL